MDAVTAARATRLCRSLVCGTGAAARIRSRCKVLTTARELLDAERIRAIDALTALVRCLCRRSHFGPPSV